MMYEERGGLSLKWKKKEKEWKNEREWAETKEDTETKGMPGIGIEINFKRTLVGLL